MRKRTILVTIVSILMIFAVVSCSDHAAAPVDHIGTISFGDTRAIAYSVDYSDKVEEMYWYYTAEKLDDGFTTGDTNGKLLPVDADISTGTPATVTPKQGLSGKTLYSEDGGFSYGYWKIILKGYKTTDCVVDGVEQTDATDQNKYSPKYTATIEEVFVSSSNTKTTAEIKMGSGATTAVVFGDIYFESENIKSTSVFELEVEDTKGTVTVPTETGVTKKDGKITYSGLTYALASGKNITGEHTMTFKLTQTLKKGETTTGTTIEVANYTLKYTVQEGTTTTIEGDMTKYNQTGDIEIESKIQEVPEQTVYKALPVNAIDETKKVATVSEDTTISYGNFSVTYPAGSKVVVTEGSTTGDVAKGTATSDAKIGLTNVNSDTPAGLEINDSDTTQKLNLTLNAAKGSDSGDGSSEANNVLLTITMDIGANRNLASIWHETTELTTTPNGTTGEYYAYTKDTGRLTLYLKHASAIYIVTKEPVAKIGDRTYYSLSEAINGTGNGDTGVTENGTLTLLNDVTFSSDITVSKSFTLDLNSKTVTARNDEKIAVSNSAKLTIANSNKDQTADFISAGLKVAEIGSANIDGIYSTDSILIDTLEKGNNGTVVTLLSDANVTTNFIEVEKTITLDLNSRTLTATRANTPTGNSVIGIFKLNTGAALTVKNGNITSTETEYSSYDSFRIPDSAHDVSLVIDNVTVTAPGGVVVRPDVYNINVTVKDSEIYYSIRSYGISTNAKNPSDKGNVNITIDSTTIEPKTNADTAYTGESTGLLLNVPTKVVIKDSTIVGQRQAAIFRGGDFTVSGNTTFKATGTNGNTYSDWPETGKTENSDWGVGNRVPLAAVVIGNRTKGSYQYPTSVKFEGTGIELKKAGDNWKHVYIYQTDGYPVTVSGYAEDWTANDDFNGAVVSSADGKTFYIAGLKSFDETVWSLEESGTTVKLLEDLAITERQQLTYGKNFTLDLNKKTLSLSKELNFGYDAYYNEVVVEEAIKNGNVSVSDGGYIRFEVGSGGTFDNVKFSSSDNKFNEAFKVWSKNDTGVNKYTFTECTFTDTSLAFKGGSYEVNKNKFDVKFENCTFSSTLGFQKEAVKTDVAYGSFVFDKCNFTNEGITFASRDVAGSPYDIDITDCTFTATSMSYNGYFIGTPWTQYAYGTMDISGTTFTATAEGIGGSSEACIEIENNLASSCNELLKITLSGNTFTTTSMNPFGVRTVSGKLTATVTLDTTKSNTFTKGGKNIAPAIGESSITWSEVN